jgi:hypothetical protein
VPERPIGTALKAVAGSNVSRGFESRPLCVTTYRLDRRFVLRAIGINIAGAGVAVLAAFLLADAATWAAVVGGVVAAALVLNAARLWLRPPVVVRTSDADARLGGQLGVPPVTLEWSQVEDVSTDGRRLLLDRGDGNVLAFPLAYVGPRATDLLRDIYDRLNTANGYTRFTP